MISRHVLRNLWTIKLIMQTTKCQLCGATELNVVIDLGMHPLADTFLRVEDLMKPEPTYPLRVLLCQNCGYVTLETIVPAEKRYTEMMYSYTSSNSPISVKHFLDTAQKITNRVKVTRKNLVVDIGSNVGTLLEAFRKQTGCRVLGVEPAQNIAELANQKGIQTMNGFFDDRVVNEIVRTHGQATIITATNVYNHITDLNRFMINISKLLAPNGVFVFEVPYLHTLVKTRAFDTIYLEHVSYFSVRPLRVFYKKFGLNIQHIKTTEYMGGSILVYVDRNQENAEVAKYARVEEQSGIYKVETYKKFMEDVAGLKEGVLKKIGGIRTRGQKIVGIGAATKGNTFLNYCGIDGSMFAFITDSSPLKIGKYTPGSRILIKSDSDITPDIHYALILPWNIAGFLMERLKNKNLEFIIPKI